MARLVLDGTLCPQNYRQRGHSAGCPGQFHLQRIPCSRRPLDCTDVPAKTIFCQATCFVTGLPHCLFQRRDRQRGKSLTSGQSLVTCRKKMLPCSGEHKAAVIRKIIVDLLLLYSSTCSRWSLTSLMLCQLYALWPSGCQPCTPRRARSCHSVQASVQVTLSVRLPVQLSG